MPSATAAPSNAKKKVWAAFHAVTKGKDRGEADALRGFLEDMERRGLLEDEVVQSALSVVHNDLQFIRSMVDVGRLSTKGLETTVDVRQITTGRR